MNKRTVPVIAIVLVVAGLVGMAATMAFLQPLGSAGWSMRGNMDAMFIEQMIPHHEDAIAMAELALTRAEHPQIKQLAKDIIETQSAEIDQMREWYRDWFDADVPDFGGSFGMMGGGMMGGAVDIEDLEAAEQFDKVFIEGMVPHHQMGIMMSQMAGSATSRPELRDLTESIIEGQSAEISKMQEWYDEWYGR